MRKNGDREESRHMLLSRQYGTLLVQDVVRKALYVKKGDVIVSRGSLHYFSWVLYLISTGKF